MSTYEHRGKVCWISFSLQNVFERSYLELLVFLLTWEIKYDFFFLPHFPACWGYDHLIVSLTFKIKKHVFKLLSIRGIYSMKESYSNTGDLKIQSLNWSYLLFKIVSREMCLWPARHFLSKQAIPNIPLQSFLFKVKGTITLASNVKRTSFTN